MPFTIFCVVNVAILLFRFFYVENAHQEKGCWSLITLRSRTKITGRKTNTTLLCTSLATTICAAANNVYYHVGN